MQEIRPADLPGEAAYQLLCGIVVPRPIARLGGPNYSTLGEVIGMTPQAGLPRSVVRWG